MREILELFGIDPNVARGPLAAAREHSERNSAVCDCVPEGPDTMAIRATRQYKQSVEQAARFAPHQNSPASIRDDTKSDLDFPRRLFARRKLSATASVSATVTAQRTLFAEWIFRPADQRSDFHQRLIEDSGRIGRLH
jgi:hypothetical protein